MKLSKKANSILALVSSIALSTAIVASSMIAAMHYSPEKSPVVDAEAYRYESGESYGGMATFSGNEKANNIFDFDGNYLDQNKYKMYCVFRSMGCSKIEACAALGSAACEGSFHSEIIEYADKDSAGNETGGHHHSEVKGSLGTYKNYEAYVDEWSQWVRDPEMRTKFTDDTMRAYGVHTSSKNTEELIEYMHLRGHSSDRMEGRSASYSVSTTRGFTLNMGFYYDEYGNGATGCGLYGFTGSALYRLFDWADEYEMDWYDIDAQLSYLVADYNIGGYGGGGNAYPVNTYHARCEASNATTIEECCEIWCKSIGSLAEGWLEKRQEAAKEIYNQFPNDGWDDDYGKKILGIAGIEAIPNRDGIIDEGIIQHYATATLLYPQNSGFLVDRTNNADLKTANNEVFKGYVNSLTGGSDTSSKYSLFELFGEDLHWYRYFGESTYTPQLLDHIWSAVDQNKTETLIKHPINTINYEAYNYLSCQVYPGRPEVLTTEDLENGDKDPRVLAIKNGWFNGYSYVLGSFKMAIAKHIVSMVAFLAGPTMLDEVVKVLEAIEDSSAWGVIKPLIMILLALAMVGFIASLVKKGIHYAKGTGAAKDAINRFIVGFLCLGFLFAGVANPAILNNTIRKGVNIIDNIFNSALASSIEDDEVIAIKDDSKATHAVLWKTAIFRPWCRGQFDEREYENLYTQYANVSDSKKMPQSHEKVDHSDQSGRAFYDSASLTGDVSVPVGGGVEIKNWAAYLYSCGSKYHIDSTLDSEKAKKIDTSVDIYFPHSSTMTTANNPDTLADTFRIVDAQMDISPQYYVSGSEINSYKNAHKLETHFYKESSIMLVNTGLLLFLVPVLYKKIMSFIMLMITIIKMIYCTLLELFKEQAGLPEFTKSLKKHFWDFVVSCLKCCLMVTLYYMFVDRGFIKMVIYCVLCVIILGFNIKDAKKWARDAKHKFNRVKQGYNPF